MKSLFLLSHGSGGQGISEETVWGRIFDISFPFICALRDVGSLPVSEIRLISIQALKLNVCRETSGDYYKIRIS